MSRRVSSSAVFTFLCASAMRDSFRLRRPDGKWEGNPLVPAASLNDPTFADGGNLGFPAENGPSAIFNRARVLLFDMRLKRRAVGEELQLPGLIVQPFDGGKLLGPAERGLLRRRFQHPDGFVIDAHRHRERMSVLAA